MSSRRTSAEGPCVIVNVTSDKCYENREWVWGYRENEPMGGRDPYSNSKGCAELVTTAYRESFFPLDAVDRHGVAARERSRRKRDRRRRLDQRSADPGSHPRLRGQAIVLDPEPRGDSALAVRSRAAARLSHAGGTACRKETSDSHRAGTSARPKAMRSRCHGSPTSW